MICRTDLACDHQRIHPVLKTPVPSDTLSGLTVAESAVGHVLQILLPLGLPDEQVKSVGSIHLSQTHRRVYQ